MQIREPRPFCPLWTDNTHKIPLIKQERKTAGTMPLIIGPNVRIDYRYTKNTSIVLHEYHIFCYVSILCYSIVAYCVI